MTDNPWSEDELLLTAAERLAVMEECRLAGGLGGVDSEGKVIRDVDGDRYRRRVGEIAAMHRTVHGEDGARERVSADEGTQLREQGDV